MKKKFVLSLVLSMFLMLNTGLSVQAEPANLPYPVVLSAEEAYREDAEAYVAAFGGTIDEAVGRLKLQGTIAELDTTLQVRQSNAFAGLWVEHTPRFRVVAQFTRGGKEIVLPYIQNGPLANIVEVQNVPTSLKQLRITHSDVIQNIQATGVPAESAIDLQTNTIKVYVTSREQLEAAMSMFGWQFPANVQVVEVERLSQPMANWFAGIGLNSGNGCTSGFSLRTSSFVKYSSTAGHCTGSNISPLGAPVFSKVQGAYDFQVNPGPAGYTIKNWAADNIFDSTPYYRVINNWWNTASVGTFLCKYGTATGFTCGTVQYNNYNYQGSPTWLLVNSTNPNTKISCGGDSGSPVYSGSTAAGELIAGWCDLTNNKFIAMPAGKYVDYGYIVIVMTAP